MSEIDFRNDLLPLKNKLFRVALRITLDRPEAEDVVEDVLVKTWEMRHTPEVQNVRNLEAYCLTMTRNLALDRAQRSESQNVSLSDTDHHAVAMEHADTAPLPDQLLERNDRLQWIHSLFESLPEKQRTILQLRDIDERSYQEITEIMQITESDMKVTLFRARQALKQLILNKGMKF